MSDCTNADMIEIHIGNSYSRITGLKTDEFRKLRKILSYQTDPSAAYFSGGFQRTNYLIDSKGNFPSGLIHYVHAFLNTNVKAKSTDIAWIDKDTRIKPKTQYRTSNAPYLYEAQIAAVSEAAASERGTISMPTGTGKSLVIASLIQILGVKTLIIVPTLELKAQLKQKFTEYFGNLKDIRIENIGNPKLKDLKDFDMLIIDEVHHAAAKTYRKLNKTAWTGIYYRFGLTATPFRTKTEEQLLLESVAGEVIYELSYKEAIKKGYIVPVEAYYVDLPKKAANGYTWAQVYNELVVNHGPRNIQIAKIMNILMAMGKYTLCLVKEIKHGKILQEMLDIEFVNGIDECSKSAIKLFSDGKIRSLIGTTGVLGEGIDTVPAEYVIIAGLGKSKSAFMQMVGRTVRKYAGKESAKVIIFRDLSHKWTKSHFNAQKKFLLDEYGVKVLKLDI